MSGTAFSKFFWSDWASDKELAICAWDTQAFWMRLLCIAAEGDPIGHVTVAGRKPTTQELHDITRFPLDRIEPAIAELIGNKVCDVTREGIMVSRRLVRDHKKRNRNALGGATTAAITPRDYKGKFTGRADRTSETAPASPSSLTHRERSSLTAQVPSAISHKPEAIPPTPQGGIAADAGQGMLIRLMELLRIADRSPQSMLRNSRALTDLLTEGLSFEHDLLPEAEAVYQRGERADAITSLKFIARGARDRKAWRSRSGNGSPHTTDAANGFAHRSDTDWRKIIWWYKTSGQWHPAYPKPADIGSYGASSQTTDEAIGVAAGLANGTITPLDAEQLKALARA